MKNIKVSDQILIENYLGGDESSFETLLLKYKDRVYTQLYLMVKNRDLAEDLFQETFIKVWKQLPNFRNESSLGTWIFRIASNTCLRQIQKEKKMPKAELPAHIQEDFVAESIETDVQFLYQYIRSI